jgi:hypothetical protein
VIKHPGNTYGGFGSVLFRTRVQEGGTPATAAPAWKLRRGRQEDEASLAAREKVVRQIHVDGGDLAHSSRLRWLRPAREEGTE